MIHWTTTYTGEIVTLFVISISQRADGIFEVELRSTNRSDRSREIDIEAAHKAAERRVRSALRDDK